MFFSYCFIVDISFFNKNVIFCLFLRKLGEEDKLILIKNLKYMVSIEVYFNFLVVFVIILFGNRLGYLVNRYVRI